MKELLEPEVLAFLFPLAIVVVVVGAYFVYLTLKVRSENELKRSLVEQGLSVEEIERIVAAGKDKDDDEK